MFGRKNKQIKELKATIAQMEKVAKENYKFMSEKCYYRNAKGQMQKW